MVQIYSDKTKHLQGRGGKGREGGKERAREKEKERKRKEEKERKKKRKREREKRERERKKERKKEVLFQQIANKFKVTAPTNQIPNSGPKVQIHNKTVP